MNENDYVLEWSQRQAQFHIDRIGDSLKNNRRNFSLNRGTDYIILAMGLTHQEASSLADAFRASKCAGAQALE